MTNKNYLGQLMEYINNYMPEGVEVETLGAINHYGSVVFSLWLNYNEFANHHKEFDRIPNAKHIFKDPDEQKAFVDEFKKRSLEKHNARVKEATRKYFSEKSDIPEYIKYNTPEITVEVLKSDSTELNDEIYLKIKERIDKRSREAVKTFAENCMADRGRKFAEIPVTADDIKHILDKATQYTGSITLPEESVFKMIHNADEYFSSIGDLDVFFSGLAKSIVEYMEREEFMEEIKNGTETTAGVLPT